MAQENPRRRREVYDANSRRTTAFAAEETHRNDSYEIEDRRWTRGYQLRDWILVVLIILVLDVGFVIAQAYLEPGLGSLP